MTERKVKGQQIDEKHIRKHKNDLFRMTAMLAPGNVFELPDTIKADMQTFADAVRNILPDKAIFKEMGMVNMDIETLFSQFLKNFNLTIK